MSDLSRSPVRFLERHGIVEPSQNRPSLNVRQMRIQNIPLEASQLDLSQVVKLRGDGDGATQAWPPISQMIDNEET